MKSGESTTMIQEPVISIDRGSKSWAVFDRCYIVHGFIKYSVEAEALAAAKAYVALRSAKPPEVVYPCIKRMSFR